MTNKMNSSASAIENFVNAHVLNAGYDPNQPRDEKGRWAATDVTNEIASGYHKQVYNSIIGGEGNRMVYLTSADGVEDGWYYCERTNTHEGDNKSLVAGGKFRTDRTEYKDTIIRKADEKEAFACDLATHLNSVCNRERNAAYLRAQGVEADDIKEAVFMHCYEHGVNDYKSINNALIDQMRRRNGAGNETGHNSNLSSNFTDDDVAKAVEHQGSSSLDLNFGKQQYEVWIDNATTKIEAGAANCRKNAVAQYEAAKAMMPIMEAIANGTKNVNGVDIVFRNSGKDAGKPEISSIRDILASELGYDPGKTTTQKAYQIAKDAMQEAIAEDPYMG